GGGLIVVSAVGRPAATMIASLLACVIVAYDIHHKGNPFGPVIMGACRALVYATTAVALTGGVSMAVVVWAIAMTAYLAGLTYAAREEGLDKIGNLWPLALLIAPLIAAMGAFRLGNGAIVIYLLLAAWITAAVYLLARRLGTGSVSRAIGWLIAG